MNLVSRLFFTVISTNFCVSCAKHQRPHVIFILADDYGFNDVSYHGSEIKTPNIDELAEEGIRLENYYVQPLCTPTRSQLMSGRYQIHTGMQHGGISPSQPNCHPLENKLLPRALKEVGYAAHMVGKWHLGLYQKECWPTRRGFDTFFGFLTGGEEHFTHEHIGCQSPELDCAGWKGLDLRHDEEVAHGYRDQYDTHMFTERAQEVLYNHDQDQPLFLYLAFQAVHEPLEVPCSYTTHYKFIKDENRRIYAGMVAAMDEGIGNITDTLKELGMWEDTVFIFSTDNGGHVDYGANNWPLRGWKRSLFEGGIRGVAFITSPRIPNEVQGTVYMGMMHVSDWFPTIVEGFAGGSVEGLDLDGFNMLEALRTGGQSPRQEILHNIDPLNVQSSTTSSSQQSKLGSKLVYDKSTPPYSETEGYSAMTQGEFNEMLIMQQENACNVFNTSIQAAIRSGDWKLITGDPGPGEWVPVPNSGIVPQEPDDPPDKRLWLFNIKEDPEEYYDLSEYHPAIVYDLFCRLQEYYDTAVPVIYPDGDAKCNPALHCGLWTNWGD